MRENNHPLETISHTHIEKNFQILKEQMLP